MHNLKKLFKKEMHLNSLETWLLGDSFGFSWLRFKHQECLRLNIEELQPEVSQEF